MRLRLRRRALGQFIVSEVDLCVEGQSMML
jgi:hypothetical protein